jgi:hypothetical protein
MISTALAPKRPRMSFRLIRHYSEGENSITVRTSVQSPLAVMSRLHKGVGGGLSWILLTDSFALAWWLRHIENHRPRIAVLEARRVG